MDDKNSEIGRLKNIIIDEEYYTNLLGMLNASEEDRNVALECIRKLDPIRNFVALCFLKKNSKDLMYQWNNTCKAITSYQKSRGIAPTLPIKFEDIYKALEEQKEYKEENEKFFIIRYADYIRQALITSRFVGNVEINIKFKEYGE